RNTRRVRSRLERARPATISTPRAGSPRPSPRPTSNGGHVAGRASRLDKRLVDLYRCRSADRLTPRGRFLSMTDSLPPLSLYVHLPWCVRKCPYCDFNSYRAESELPEAAYVDALLRDLDAERDAANGRKVQSIYVGGGTPSLFSGDAVARLLDGIRARVDLEPDAEITLEANPGVADAAR